MPNAKEGGKRPKTKVKPKDEKVTEMETKWVGRDEAIKRRRKEKVREK